MKYFIWFLKALFYQTVINFTKRKKKWILSRTACLFNDSYKLIGLSEFSRYNVQKGRIDLWISYFTNNNQRASLSYIKFLYRGDIQKLFLQQIYFDLPITNKPSLFVIDSFSELVDKKFVSKKNNKISIFAYFSDVNESILEIMNCEDLLPLDKIFETYEVFFSLFRNYTNCPIVYIFFPDKLETRELFLKRAKVIKESINLLSKRYNDFYLIDVPFEIVRSDVNDPNVYHYSKETYEYIASKFKELNLIPFN
jgi:hypothetical protein